MACGGPEAKGPAVYNRKVANPAAKTDDRRKGERRRFTLGQRFVLAVASTVIHALLWPVLITLRWSYDLGDAAPNTEPVKPAIYVFWHRCLAPAVYRYSNRGLAVMISSSFDGELVARVAEKFGYQAVRGSSTRGGARALLGMHKVLAQGEAVVFTIDGPKGPRYVAKPGPVMLARNTGAPIWAFHIALERAWVLGSWDRMMLPKPFSRALLCVSSPIFVEADASDEKLAEYHAEMQAWLDAMREKSEAAMRRMTGRNA